MTVPEDRNFKLIQSDKITQKKKKRKGKKKQKQGIKGSSSTIPENKGKLYSRITTLYIQLL